MRKFGKKVYDGKNEVKREDIGPYICPNCHKTSRLIRQKGYGFQNVLSVCEKGHTFELTKQLYEKYHVGDRIRLYESTFGKDAVIRLDSYCEGVITRSYPNLIDYQFDFVVDVCVINGIPLKKDAWVIGSLHRGVDHSNTCVKLLEKAQPDVLYEQMSFV